MKTYNSNATKLPTMQIISFMSVSPLKITEPRQVRRVLSAPGAFGFMKGCLNAVLYYNKAGLKDDDSGWLHAGRIKESLGTALLEQPLLAGRARRRMGPDGPLVEIVSNDAGVRVVEARMAGVTLTEFLGSEVDEWEKAESRLVFWSDIDEEDPKFSPLFYLQVTNFECGGYSFGISCSLLLADLWFTSKFLKKWSEIHNNILISSSESPTFYLPKLKPDSRSTTSIISPSPCPKTGHTMIFHVHSENNNKPMISSLALLCVEKAEAKLLDSDGHGVAKKAFNLLVNKSENDLQIKEYKRHEIDQVKQKLFLDNARGVTALSCDNWDEIGAQEVEFRRGNCHVRGSCWINGSSSSETTVVAIASSKSEAKIMVTVPKEIVSK